MVRIQPGNLFWGGSSSRGSTLGSSWLLAKGVLGQDTET